MEGGTSEPPDWSTTPIDQLHGHELEWSTIMPLTRKMRRKVCIFCSFSYTGGPFKVRQHLDRDAKKPREVLLSTVLADNAFR